MKKTKDEWFYSNNLFKRAFAVWGYNIVANLIIMLIFFIIGFLLGI